MILHMGLVMLLATVQSVFGIGLLVLGTPVLLLLHVQFDETLWLLLPASFAVSLLQISEGISIDLQRTKSVVCWALPCLVVGLVSTLLSPIRLKIGACVAIVLIGSALTRLWEPVRRSVARIFFEREIPVVCVIGFVHGLTNMGGSILASYAGIRFRDKDSIRQFIAIIYALFAASQAFILSLMSPPRNWWMVATSGFIGVIGFLFIGRLLFRAIPFRQFSYLFSGMECCCAGLLLVKAFSSNA